jgi:hypothetical protein
MTAPIDRRGRHAALVRGLDLVAGAGVVWMVGGDARSAGAKKPDPAAVQYVDVGASPGPRPACTRGGISAADPRFMT